jgi:hypothetical protein
MADSKRTKDTPCPHCGVLFFKNNLPMHVAARHAGGSSTKPAARTPAREPASRSRAASAPADPPAGDPPPKKPYDVLDSSTW